MNMIFKVPWIMARWKANDAIQRSDDAQNIARSRHRERLLDILRKSNFTDIEFTFPGDIASDAPTLAAHRCILSLSLPKLSRLLREEWENLNTIEISNYSRSTFRRILEYIYLGRLDNESLTLAEMVELEASATEYDIQHLKQLVLHEMSRAARESPLNDLIRCFRLGIITEESRSCLARAIKRHIDLSNCIDIAKMAYDEKHEALFLGCARFLWTHGREAATMIRALENSDFKMELALLALGAGELSSDGDSNRNEIESGATLQHSDAYRGPDFGRLFEDEQYSDVFFEFEQECDNQDTPQRIPAHRVALSAASPVIYNRFLNDWSEKDVIPVKIYSYRSFRQFVRYLYTFDGVESNVRLGDILEIKAIAEEFSVDELITLCNEQYNRRLRESPSIDDMIQALETRFITPDAKAQIKGKLALCIDDSNALRLAKFAYESDYEDLFIKTAR
jgi:hypothetical protein